jgi:hypothetical protein
VERTPRAARRALQPRDFHRPARHTVLFRGTRIVSRARQPRSSHPTAALSERRVLRSRGISSSGCRCAHHNGRDVAADCRRSSQPSTHNQIGGHTGRLLESGAGQFCRSISVTDPFSQLAGFWVGPKCLSGLHSEHEPWICNFNVLPRWDGNAADKYQKPRSDDGYHGALVSVLPSMFKTTSFSNVASRTIPIAMKKGFNASIVASYRDGCSSGMNALALACCQESSGIRFNCSET